MATDRASACSGTGAAQPVLEGVDRLRQSLRGQIVVPSDAGYEQARKVWNGAIDRRPALIVYCSCSSDVVKAVNFARGGHHAVAVRSGGHNLAGLSVCDAGVVIDLSRMKQIDVDPVRRIARAQAGLTLHEFDEATQAHGLATTMGVNGDTGIAGLTLGGGFGKLGRKYGLACDNLAAVEMVTADGECRRASATENPDLFWAVRGGGGNFGIVTTFEYVLHPIGTHLLAGSLAYRYGDARDAMRFYAAFARSAPDELSLDLTGRVKDIFKTAKGKYVAPLPLEQKLLEHRHIEAACVAGAGLAMPFALLQLAAEVRDALANGTCDRAALTDELAALRARINAAAERHEQLQYVVVVKDVWSAENAMLTPTLKIRRAAIEARYLRDAQAWSKLGRAVVWEAR
ncbi:FAD-binding oxidoreductase [Paraburkholderia silviterrae]|uniref:FAD-binding protein n=1 Tax=Paraburkholderia silviterrae TaxID=2528715 RepID=A0A4R5LZN9_9BURK|nr:FAD-binding oxidoreductase [Paraburkholderia silviterrae]TDG18086.1 FAD-binding protein [Paraburkholderia silviterrae]